jgi:hypothetical protein
MVSCLTSSQGKPGNRFLYGKDIFLNAGNANKMLCVRMVCLGWSLCSGFSALVKPFQVGLRPGTLETLWCSHRCLGFSDCLRVWKSSLVDDCRGFAAVYLHILGEMVPKLCFDLSHSAYHTWLTSYIYH